MSIASSFSNNPLLRNLNEFMAQEATLPIDKRQELFHLIASDRPDKVIIAKINEIISSKSLNIDSPSRFFATTPLTLAVMKNRLRITELLLKAHADPNYRDEFGWTPMIHAALATNTLAGCLQAHGGIPTRISYNAVSYETLCLLTSKDIDNPSLKRLILQDSEGKLTVATKRAAEKVMNLTQYRSKSFYHPQHLKFLWNERPQEDILDTGYHKLACEGVQLGLPLLAIKNDTVLNALGLPKAKGLFAAQKIVKGQFISTYCGESFDAPDISFLKVFFTDYRPSPYQFGLIDALKVGNETRMINDGMPNLCAISVGHDVYFLASQDIEEGEELLFNYGPADMALRWGHYVIKRKEELYTLLGSNFRAIFEQEQRFEKFKSQKSACTSQFIMDQLKMSSEVGYAFFSPQVLIDLVVNKVVSVEQIKLIRGLNFIKDVSDSDPNLFVWINELIDYLEKFDLTLQKIQDASLLQSIRDCLISKEGRLNTFQILNLMQNIERLIDEHSSEEIVNLFPLNKESFEQKAASYKFLKFDSDMPLFRDIDLDHNSMSDDAVFEANSQRLSLLAKNEDGTFRVAKNKMSLSNEFAANLSLDDSKEA